MLMFLLSNIGVIVFNIDTFLKNQINNNYIKTNINTTTLQHGNTLSKNGKEEKK